MDGAPEQAWLRDTGIAMRMWASCVRSIHNFYFAQEIRNRHTEILSGPAKIHSLINDPGEPDNLRWSQIQRNEFDNANEFLALLNNKK